MCEHLYITTCKKYYDKNLECRVRKEKDICIFCGHKSYERVFRAKDPPKKQPKTT